jgi:hypothetical protein
MEHRLRSTQSPVPGSESPSEKNPEEASFFLDETGVKSGGDAAIKIASYKSQLTTSSLLNLKIYTR